MSRTANPHKHEVGYVESRHNSLTNSYTVLYDRKKIDTNAENRWCLVCSEHGNITYTKTKKTAISLLSRAFEWCENCCNLAEIEEAEYMLTLRSKRDHLEQLKRLASLVIDNPEKSVLFERLTGNQPQYYLDEK